MNSPLPTLTLHRETVAALNATAAEPQQPRDGRYPTTTVLTRFVSCTAC